MPEEAEKVTRTGGRAATTGVIKGRYALSVGNPATKTPPGWKWTLLTDVARLETGHTPSRRHPEWWGGKIPWVGIRDATSNHGRKIYETAENTNALGIANSSARVLPADTVCLSRTASVGYVVVMGRPMATSQDFVNWVCTKAIDYRFLKYVLIAEKDALLQYASGTTHQTIYFPEVKAFHVCLPTRGEQAKIADVLSALDDKIELNRSTVETLETMARALFKSWLIDFDPVRARAGGRPTGLPADFSIKFPDSLGDDRLPVGWSPMPLSSIARFLNGLALQKYPPNKGEPSLPVIKIAELRTGPTEKSGRASSSIPADYHVKNGDHLFSWSGSLTHRRWAFGEGALNQHLFKVTPLEGYPDWLVYLSVDHYLPQFQSIAAGKAVTMGHIQRRHLDEALVSVPPPRLLSKLSTIFAPLFERCLSLELEGRTLAELRDTLLPKLMTGELRVADTDKQSVAA